MKDLCLLIWLKFQSAIIGAWPPDCHQQTADNWRKAAVTARNFTSRLAKVMAQTTTILIFA
jgi:hypothetical protein